MMRIKKMPEEKRTTKINQDKPCTKQAQSTLEYALIIAVVVAALTAMSVYVQRSIQANLKTVEEQINAEPVQPAP